MKKIMKLTLLHSLNLKISISVFTFLLMNCNTSINNDNEIKVKNAYEDIKLYFKEKQNYFLKNKIKTIFILTDIGCMPCNKHFSNLITDNLNDTSSLFLVLASSTNIDLTEFKKNKTRVFYDKPENIKDNLLRNSKAIFIKNNKIDTAITIDARQIDLQFREIKERLNQE